jgi:hypothetical protein
LTQEASIETRPSGTLAQLTGSLDLRVETSDPVVHHLGVCLETARARPSEMMSVCVDHIVSALQAYLRCTQNIVSPHPGIARGGSLNQPVSPCWAVLSVFSFSYAGRTGAVVAEYRPSDFKLSHYPPASVMRGTCWRRAGCRVN